MLANDFVQIELRELAKKKLEEQQQESEDVIEVVDGKVTDISIKDVEESEYKSSQSDKEKKPYTRESRRGTPLLAEL